MPSKGFVFGKRKRHAKLRGIHAAKARQRAQSSLNEQSVETQTPNINTENPKVVKACSSAIKNPKQDENPLNQPKGSSPPTRFILIDVDVLFTFLSSNVRCGECSHYSLSCELSENTRRGLSQDITLSCTNCKEWSTKLKTSGEGQVSGQTKTQTVTEEINGVEESDIFPTVKRASPTLSCLSDFDQNSFSYCEKCQRNSEEGCPEHGHLIYIDNAETGQGCSQDPHPCVQAENGTLPGRVRKLTHDDDVETLPNRDYSTQSDQMFLVCEMNTAPCMAGASCELQGKAQINTHQETHKTGKQFTCDLCRAKFAFISKLKIHMRRHTGEKPHKCEMCGIGFAQIYCLKIHKRRHEKRFCCDVCGLLIANTREFISHKRTHTGEKPYCCDVCGLLFGHPTNLQKHKRNHTGVKPYVCDICGMKFAENGVLQRHKRRHTGEKTFICNICGVKFFANKGLVRHKRTHTGERPYKCSVCDAAFAASYSLVQHMRRHTLEKPYKCDVCGVGFAFNSQCKIHKRKH